MKRFFLRVFMLAAGIALSAGPAAWADEGESERRGPSGDGRYFLAQHDYAQQGPGSGKERHQGRYQAQHGKKGQKGRRAPRMAQMRHRIAKMMRRTLRFIIPRLSPGQREQVRKLRLEIRRQLNTNRARLKNFRLDMRETMRQFPVDQDAVKAIFDQMAKLRRAMLSFRLSALAQIQNMAGKKLWEEARAGARRKPGSHPAPRPGHEKR